MKKFAVAVALVIVSAFPVSSATAAQVPAGQSFYGFSWFGELFQIDPTTGVSTSIFTVEEASESAAADYNPVDGNIYVLAPYDDCQLLIIDPTDASFTTVELTVDAGSMDWCRALTITDDGTIFASLDDDNLYELNGETGAATFIGPIGSEFSATSMAYDEANDVLYAALDSDGLYVLDQNTGLGTKVGLDDYDLNGAMDFDSDGTLWLTDWNQFTSVDVSDYSATTEGVVDLGLPGEADDGTEAGFFAPDDLGYGEPLADTGFDAGPSTWAAIVAGLGGVAAVMIRRRRNAPARSLEL